MAHMRIKTRITLYGMAFFFEGIADAVLFTLMTPMIKSLGGTDFETLLAHTMYGIGMMTSFVWGSLSDVLGRKVFLRVGSAAFIPLMLMGLVLSGKLNIDPIPAFYILIFVYSALYAMTYPSLIAEASLESNPSRAFGSVSFGDALGWGLGGVIAGAIVDRVSMGALWAFICASLSYLVFALLANTIKESRKEIRRKYKYKFRYSALMLLISVFFLNFGREWVYGLFSIKTYLEILGGSTFYYSIFVTMLPSVISALAVPIYARLTEKLGGLITYGLSIFLYSLLVPMMAMSTGYVGLIIWVLPVWPAYDIGSKKSGEELVPKTARGKIIGAMTAMVEMAMIIAAVGGYFSDILGRRFSIFLGGLLVVVAIVPYALIFYFKRREPKAQ
ncbi:MAG: MFS transporter [Euryarchaeota archaeon]|nr:MFS transporter [Euryarchaeota archaeon]